MENIAASHDAVTHIRQAIDSLKEPYRQVAFLFFLRQYTAGEIAQTLGRPVKTVHTQLGRARSQLQARLTDEKGAYADGIY